MATGEQVKKLIASYGRAKEFRAAAETIIVDADKRGYKPLASALRKMVEAHVRDSTGPKRRSLTGIAELADPALELLDVATVERGLDQIILSDEAGDLVDNVLTEQRHGEELRRHRLPLRSKILLCGPPGCGKTLCAEVLARELSMPLYIAKLDVLISSFLGETATNLRRMFEFASSRPSVLFLDEFDALARARTDAGEHNELRRVVNSLLTLIDRYNGRGILVAATNLEGSLDNAVWRRFDEAIFLDLPTCEQILLLLKLRFRNFPVTFKFSSMVTHLDGMSCAEIERICFDSIKATLIGKRKKVNVETFKAAVNNEKRRKAIVSRASERQI